MTLWTCRHCNCLYIAASLNFCPHCFTVKGEDVPKTTVQDGHTNIREEPATSPAEDSPVEPAEAPVEPVAAKPVRRARKVR